MSTLAHHARRWSIIGGTAAAPFALAAALEHLVPRVTTRSLRPSFQDRPLDPGSHNRYRPIGFHGLWTGPLRYDPIAGCIDHWGQFRLANNGANVLHTPAAALATFRLSQAGEPPDPRPILPMGYSFGSQTTVQFLRGYEQLTGQTLPRAIVYSGMACCHDVRWPVWREILRLLGGGPLSTVVWRRYWDGQISQAVAGTEPPEVIASLRYTRDMHVRTVMTGVYALIQGLKLQPNEFPHTRLLVVEHETDPLVHGCFTSSRPRIGWKEAFPDSDHVVIPGEGHADFRHHSGTFTRIIDDWLGS